MLDQDWEIVMSKHLTLLRVDCRLFDTFSCFAAWVAAYHESVSCTQWSDCHAKRCGQVFIQTMSSTSSSMQLVLQADCFSRLNAFKPSWAGLCRIAVDIAEGQQHMTTVGDSRVCGCVHLQAARCILQVLHAQAVASFGRWPDPLAGALTQLLPVVTISTGSPTLH